MTGRSFCQVTTEVSGPAPGFALASGIWFWTRPCPQLGPPVWVLIATTRIKSRFTGCGFRFGARPLFGRCSFGDGFCPEFVSVLASSLLKERTLARPLAKGDWALALLAPELVFCPRVAWPSWVFGSSAKHHRTFGSFLAKVLRFRCLSVFAENLCFEPSVPFLEIGSLYPDSFSQMLCCGAR